MSEQQFNALTATQRRWLEHLHRCQARGQSMAAYARAEGLDLKTLYNWRSRLKQKGVLESPFVETGAALPHFQKVVVARESSFPGTVRLHWPNGRVLEFDSGVDSGYVKRLIERLEG